jgi:uncharacterized membrane protein (UPF0127 family)
MKKKLLMIIIVIILILIPIAVYLFKTAPPEGNAVVIGHITIPVEIADSPDEWARGLMFRTYLNPSMGMLFIFDKSETHQFWMKNTLIPLDMLFINEKKEIISIETATPCHQDPCMAYGPQEATLYVLEINSGLSEKNKISVGDKVKVYLKK